MYRALNTAHQLPAEKDPGVRPLVCGEVWMRLICGVVKRETRDQATEACGSNQLCTGLKCGIEGALHAALTFWPQSAGWQEAQDRAAEEEDAEEESAGDEAKETAERLLTQEQGSAPEPREEGDEKEGDGKEEDQRPLTQESKAGEEGGSEGRLEPIRGAIQGRDRFQMSACER